MDTREKFNIKQMVDCERQEPFYPVTHAQAVKIINNGQIVNLQDVIGDLLEFVRDFDNIELQEQLTIGIEDYQAFRGSDGYTLTQQMLTLYPVQQSIVEDTNSGNYTKPISSKAFLRYIDSLLPDGEIKYDEDKSVSGGTVFRYIQENLLGGEIVEGNDKLVIGGDIYEAIKNLQPEGTVTDGNTQPVSGGAVYSAIQEHLQDPLWESGQYAGSIKQVEADGQDLGLDITNNNEVAIGYFNYSAQGSTLFTVGCGEDDRDRCNAIEVTNDTNNSLKVPYNNSTVSIQQHMRNEQQDICHLTQLQLDRLNSLIDANFKVSASFTATPDYNYYDTIKKIAFTWSIKNKNKQPASDITFIKLLFANDPGTNFNNVIVQQENTNGFSLSSYPDSNYTINSSSSPINLGNLTLKPDGHSKYKFKFQYKTTEMLSTNEIEVLINLYAPSYIFSSTSNLETTIPNEATKAYFNSFNNFNAQYTIPSGDDSRYIYIAIPTFMVNEGTFNGVLQSQPLKDFDSGFEFTLDDTYLETSTKDFSLLPESNTSTYVNYKIQLYALKFLLNTNSLIFGLFHQNQNSIYLKYYSELYDLILH